MTSEVTSLALAVDSSQVTTAAAALDKLGTAGKGAESASSRLEKAFASMLAETKGIGASIQDLVKFAAAANATAVATAKIAPQMEAVQKASFGASTAINKFSASGLTLGNSATSAASIAAALGKVATSGAAAATATAAVTQGVAQAAAAARTASAAAGSATTATAAITRAQTASAALGRTNGLAAYQTLQLSNQLQDFFVQVQGGGSPLTALIQQGSQLSAVYGGFGAAIRGVLGIFTPFVLGVGSIVAAVAAVSFALIKGSDQSREFAKSIALTGNAAGITEGQFNSLYRSIADGTKTSAGASRETLQTLVASGRLSGDALGATATAIQQLSKATGESTDDIAKRFISLTDNVARGAEELNKQYHFLSAAQLDQIKNLEEQGKSQEAVAKTFTLLSVRIGTAANDLGFLERAWDGVKRAASGAIDIALDVGRVATPEEQIQRQRDRVARNAKVSGVQALTGSNQSVADVVGAAAAAAQAKSLEDVVKYKQQGAQADAANAQRNTAAIAFDKLKEQSLTKQAQLSKELANANALADSAGATPSDRAAVLAGIRAKYAGLDSDANALNKANLDKDISAIEQALSKKNDAYKNAQSVLNAIRATGAVSDRQFYEAQRVNIELTEAAEVGALQAENARLARQKFVGKDAVKDQIENGQKIAENLTKIQKVRADNAAAAQVIDIQEAAAQKKRAAGYLAEALAAQQSYEAQQRANGLDLSFAKTGNVDRARLSARAQIEDQFRQQQEAANRDIFTKRAQGSSSDDEADYAQRTKLITDFKQRALDQFDDYYTKRKVQDDDYNNGYERAIANYVDNARNTANLIENAYTNVFNNLEDAIVGFVTTGKLNFKSLADSIIAEFVRIQVKSALASVVQSGSGGGGFLSLLSTVAGAFGGFSTGTSASIASALPGDSLDSFLKLNNNFSTGRAAGGPVSPRSLQPVNELGPELLETGGKQYLLMGSQSGNVVPNNKVGGSAHTIINQTTGRVDKASMVTLPDGERALLLQEAADRAYNRVVNDMYDPNSRYSRSQKATLKAERNRS